MMTNHNDIDKLIAHFLCGESTPMEEAALQEWLAAGDYNRQQYNLIRRYWGCRVERLPDDADDKGLRKLRQDLGRKPHRHKLKAFWFAAASLVAGLSVGLFITWPDKVQQTMTVVTGNVPGYYTLADGTRVHLNNDTQLTYGNDFADKHRHVSIMGEVLFEVEKDTQRPFRVDLGDDIYLTVTGTTVSARNTGTTISVSLAEGSVTFTVGSREIYIEPGQRLDYDTSTGRVTVAPYDHFVESAWTDNLLRYRSVKFDDLMQLLASSYGVDIELNGTVPTGLYSGTFSLSLDAGQVLEILSGTIPMRWKYLNGKYIVEP